jgi:hypothetical protein
MTGRAEVSMSTVQVFYRNPHNYAREMVEANENWAVWDAGVLLKKALDPITHAEMYFGGMSWRVLISHDNGCQEYQPGDKAGKPRAVYPVWSYGENGDELEELLEHPVGEDADLCSDGDIPLEWRPVFGQEHRILINQIPNINTAPGRNFMRWLQERQEEHPEAIIHLHNLYSYRAMFGMGFKSVDIDGRTNAAKSHIVLPTGKVTSPDGAYKYSRWINLLGMSIPDLKIPSKRCIYNIKSARWASQFYAEAFNLKTKGSTAVVDTETSDDQYKPVQTVNRQYFTRQAQTLGDKILCDMCSLQLSCNSYRTGAVCTLPGAEPAHLAAQFKTRDAGQILDGLGTLMATQTRRLERGMKDEEVFGELDPEVTKIINSLFEQGRQMALLRDPTLRPSGTRVQVNVGQGGQAAFGAVGTPAQFIAGVVGQLESQGFTRDQITPEMVNNLLTSMAAPAADNHRVIQGAVVKQDDDSLWQRPDEGVA